MRSWDGTLNPTNHSAAPQAAFGVEHIGRLFVAGVEGAPLTCYFSGVGDLDDWTTTSGGTYITSGFFNIADRIGEKITALIGNYFGSLIIGTSHSIWRLTGNDPLNNFTLECISSNVGIAGPRAWERVGNTLMFSSLLGIHSLDTTLQFGDIKSQFISTRLLSRWIPDSYTDLTAIAPEYMERATVAYSPQRGNVIFGVPLQGDTDIQHGFLLNVANSQWAGPWDITLAGLKYVRLSVPEMPVFMHGTLDGKVGYIYSDNKCDFGVLAYNALFESARLDGRTIDEGYRAQIKKWRELRIYIQPRGNYDLTAQWWTDEEDSAGSVTYSQNPRDVDTLTNDFRLGHSTLSSAEAVDIITIPLDSSEDSSPRGRWFRFHLQQPTASQDFIYRGFEADFVPQTFTKDNK